MDGATMLSEWRLGFDVIASGAAPGFLDSQVYSLLNRAQDLVIDNLIEKKRYDLLGDITIEIDQNDVPSYSISGNWAELQMPADYWRYIDSVSIISKSAFSTSGIIKSVTGAMKVRNKFVNPVIFDKINVPDAQAGYNSYNEYKNPFCTILSTSVGGGEDSALIVRGDHYTTITSVYIRYARKRADISGSQTCELELRAHRSVVDKAVDIAKEIINVQEPQSSNIQ